jgi:O-antigen ligase
MLNLIRNQDGPLFAFTGLTTFADLLVLAGIVAASLLFPMGRLEKPAWRFVVPGLLIATVLVWSRERAPVIVLAAAGSARFAAAGRRGLAAGVLIAGACLLLGPTPLSDKMVWLIRGNPVDRFVVWEEGLKQVPHAPLFGYGPGSYTAVLPAGAWGKFINRAPSSWHNDLLETWLDSGPLAAGAFGGLLFFGVWRAGRGAFPRRGGKSARPGSEPGLLFLCLALFGLVGSVVTTSVLGLAFWLLLGLTLNSRRGKDPLPAKVLRSS